MMAPARDQQGSGSGLGWHVVLQTPHGVNSTRIASSGQLASVGQLTLLGSSAAGYNSSPSGKARIFVRPRFANGRQRPLACNRGWTASNGKGLRMSQLAADGTESGARRDARRLLALALTQAMMLAACKACLLPWTGWRPGSLARWTARVAILSAQDVLFVLLLTVALWGLVGAQRRWWTACDRVVWSLIWMLTLACVTYAVVSVPVFLRLNIQLSYPLLSFLGGWRELSQSLLAAASLPAVVALLFLPLVFVLLYRVSLYLLDRRWVSSGVGVRAASAVVLALYLAGSIWFAQTHWRERSLWQARVVRSPHLALLRSFLGTAPWGELPTRSRLTDEERASFLPIAHERTTAAQPTAATPLASPRGAASTPGAAHDHLPKNVILLVLESVGAGYMQIHGAPYANTPHLHALRHQSLIFDNIQAQCPSSAKALVALVTGTYPRLDSREQTQDADARLPSLASMLGERGYKTAFVHSGNWAWRGGDAFVRNHGFDYFRDARDEPLERDSWGTADTWLADQVFRWIDANPADAPFFAMCWTIQTHHPYRVMGREREFGVADKELNRYLNAIAEADALIGRIWSELGARGLADSTLLAVVGDHGQAFGQHEQRLHIFGLYEENVHVPLVVIHSGRVLPVGRIATVGQQIDVAPTLCGCLGFATPAPWQGRSLLASDHPNRAHFYTLWDPVLLGVRQGDIKYFWEPGGAESMFDLRLDPSESHNLAQQRPDLAEELRRRAKALVTFQRQWLTEQRSRAALTRR